MHAASQACPTGVELRVRSLFPVKPVSAVESCVWLLCTCCCCLQAASPSRQELQLFLQEVQTLAQLHHRNIVQFYGACLEPGSLFFVTELMKVGTVEHLLNLLS